jgi:hypothetical protein
MILETDKSQDLQLATGDSTQPTAGIVPVRSKGLRTRRDDGVSSTLKAGRLKTQEKLTF